MPKPSIVNAAMPINPAGAEHFEELVVAKSLESSKLQFEQRILVRVDVDAMDALGIVNHVIQRIAACTRDHHDALFSSNAADRIIYGRIFPPSLIAKIARVDLIKKPLGDGQSHAGIFAP